MTEIKYVETVDVNEPKRSYRPRTVEGVKLDRSLAEDYSNGRTGTIWADPKALRKALGPPHHNRKHSGDGKVSAAWYFSTPAGPAAIWMFWSNEKNEWSFSGDAGALAPLVAFIRARGCECSRKYGY